MGAQDIIRQLEELDAEEVAKVRDWIQAHEESDELLAAIDEGIQDLEAGRITEFRPDELRARVRAWAGGSR